ncbi:MAG: hypothetical protein ACI93R_004035, partial [Flavobacteriales bacterium]
MLSMVTNAALNVQAELLNTRSMSLFWSISRIF